MQDLESLKYAELRKLAKKAGVKANQKQEKLIAALKQYYENAEKEAKSKPQTPKTPKVVKSTSKSFTPASAVKKASTPMQKVPSKGSATRKVLTPAKPAVLTPKNVGNRKQEPTKQATPKAATPARAKSSTPVQPKIATPKAKVTTPVQAKASTPVQPKVATPKAKVATPVGGRGSARKRATPTKSSQGTPASNKGASRWEKKVWRGTPELAKKSPGSGKRKQQQSTPEVPATKKRRSTFETVPTPELITPVVSSAKGSSSGRKGSTGKQRKSGGTPGRKSKTSRSPGVKDMLSAMKPEMSSAEMKESLLSAIDKKVQDKAKNAPPSASNIPRFAAFLKKRDEAKPITPGNKNWDKIHKKNFAKFDSIDVYLEKKRKRAEEITASVKKARTILDEVHTAVDKLKAHKTPQGIENKKPRYSNPNRTTPFQPTVISTAGMNLNFGTFKSPKTLPRKSPKSVLSSTKAANTASSARKSVGANVPKKPTTTPFKFTAINTSTVESSSQKSKFDLKASLARPITWKTHKGKLKPVVPEGPAYVQPSAASQVKAKKDRTETRKNVADRRAQKKNNAAMARRGIKM